MMAKDEIKLFNFKLVSNWFARVRQAILLQNQHDIRFFNILVPAAITGTVFGVYFTILSILVICAAKTKARCLSVFPFSLKFFFIRSIIDLIINILNRLSLLLGIK